MAMLGTLTGVWVPPAVWSLKRNQLPSRPPMGATSALPVSKSERRSSVGTGSQVRVPGPDPPLPVAPPLPVPSPPLPVPSPPVPALAPPLPVPSPPLLSPPVPVLPPPFAFPLLVAPSAAQPAAAAASAPARRVTKAEEEGRTMGKFL